jgi:predicted RND superfamily exporter protein
VVALSIVASVGLVAMLGWELDLTFSMLPTLLIAVGVANSVHIISEFRAYHVETGDRREAVSRTMYLVGTPCLLTSLTTAAGFASMSVAPIKSISHFAFYSAFGVITAFVLSVTLLIVLLSLGQRTVKRQATEREKVRAKGGQLFANSVARVARFDIRHRKAILAVAGGVFVFSVLGMARIRVDSNFLDDFSEDVPARQATIFVDHVMSGTNSFVYLFDTGVPDGIKEPEVLREIARLQAEADKQTSVVTKTYSIVDLLKDINQSFHDGDPEYFALPDTRELVAQYLLLWGRARGLRLQRLLSRQPGAALPVGQLERRRRDGREPRSLP